MTTNPELTGDDVLDGLAALGIDTYPSGKQDEVKVHCLNPSHPDADPSMSINVGDKAGVFYCFSCLYHGHIITFFREQGYNPFPDDMSLEEQNQRALKRLTTRQKHPLGKLPARYIPGTPWRRGDWRGIPEYILRKYFRARHWYHTQADGTPYYDSDGVPIERIVLPVYFRHLYYGFSARYLGKDKTLKNKYYNTKSLPTKNLLYLYDMVREREPVIIVEGPFDALRLRYLGYNALCNFGVNWSTDKTLVVMRLQPPLIILMLDADAAGQAAINRINGDFERWFPRSQITQFPMIPDHDPGDVPEDYLISTLADIPRHPLT